MELWQTFLVAFGGNAVLLALLAWLLRSVVQQWLNKDIEKFKTTLLLNSSVATDTLRHSLALSAAEHQIKYSRLHERRAEALHEVYEALQETLWSMNSFASRVQGLENESSQLQKFEDAMQKSKDLRRIFEKRKLYLPKEVCVKIDELIRGMGTQAYSLGFHLRIADSTGKGEDWKQAREKWLAVAAFFEQEVPNALSALEDDMRSILDHRISYSAFSEDSLKT